jgi:hypothetical protein
LECVLETMGAHPSSTVAHRPHQINNSPVTLER